MDLKLIKEEINSSRSIFSSVQEQAVELDYVLPDYYPEIHKIIKCIAEPCVTSRNISDSILSYDITLSIKILYCSENDNAINVIDQKLMYSKNIDIQQNTLCPDIKIAARTDYINCRAVNSKRIDLRGAISTDITVKDITSEQLIADASGDGIQLLKIPVIYPTDKHIETKQAVISEEFELGSSKPNVNSIIYTDASVVSLEKKVIANKIIVKGELSSSMLYTYNSNGMCGAETMQLNIPFSQIIDMDGVDENFESRIDTEVISCEIQPHSSGDGNADSMECRVTLLIKCYAFRISSIELASDQYSTKFETAAVHNNVTIESIPQYINQNFNIKAAIDLETYSPENIYGIRCKLKNCTVFSDNDNIVVNGAAEYMLFACDNENKAFICERTENFTVNIPFSNLDENSSFDISVHPLLSSYNIISENKLDVSTEINVYGTVSHNETINAVSDITVQEKYDDPESSDCALKLYFAQSGENIWDIVKLYRAPMDTVMAENDLCGNTITDNCMLIIPIL